MSRRLDESEWEGIAERFEADCVAAARDRLDRDGLVSLTRVDMGAKGECSPEEAERLLEHLATLDAVTRVEVLSCPRCEEILTGEEAEGASCPHCGEAFDEHPEGVLVRVRYERSTEPGRSVPWVLALHGMNTRGAWQEELSWLVATTYGRSVPVFVYKYGLVRPGVFLKWRQRMLRDRLASKLRRLSEGLGDRQLGSRPDVLAHSFGTWLIGHALLEHEDLRVGRVVLMGSILRPDFPWNELRDRGQVEAVVNHYGRRDFWAGVASYVIPDSGPSGRRGFDRATGVLNRPERDFAHSSFFRENEMRSSYQALWRPFLQRPLIRLVELGTLGNGPWQRPPLILRATIPRWMLLAVGTVMVAVLAVSLILGIFHLAAIF